MDNMYSEGVCKMNYLYYDNTLQKSVMVNENRLESYRCSNIRCLDMLCRKCGTTYLGSSASIKDHLHVYKKVPILVYESMDYIFFPTCSVRSKDCVWINYGEVKTYFEVNSKVKIIFMDESELILDISYYTFVKQMKRCKKYLHLIRQQLLCLKLE